jgi:hypothetical protein
MFAARLDCLACHVQPQGVGVGTGKDGTTFVASEKACTNCHGDQYRGMLKDWKATFEAMIRDIDPKLNAARQVSESVGAKGGKGVEARRLFEEAQYNIDFVKIGKGVHNPFYASELIQVADRNIDHLFRLVGQPPPPLPEQSPIRGGYCAQLCHAKAGVKLPPETSLQGVKLPHARHAFEFGLACTTCHSAEKHKEVKIAKEDCMACHHKPENTQCSRCHQKQASLYWAQNLPVDVKEARANVKAGKVECVICHDLSKKQTLENISRACTQCHDPAYVDMVRGWKEETLEALKKTRSSLGEASKKLTAAKKDKAEAREAAGEFERAKKAYEFIAQAKGVHNPELAGLILEQAQKGAQKVEESLARPGKSSGN